LRGPATTCRRTGHWRSGSRLRSESRNPWTGATWSSVASPPGSHGFRGDWERTEQAAEPVNENEPAGSRVEYRSRSSLARIAAARSTWNRRGAWLPVCAHDFGPPNSSSHSTTSSARRSTDGGIVKPSALAALRLMTSSNFVGCSTGRSAGLAPFRILSTYVAARWNISAKSGP